MPTWTLIGSDDFTETSNTNLESHTPSGANALASNWVHLTFQASFSMVVDGAADKVGQPYHGGTGYRNPYTIGPAANAVQRADVKGLVDNRPGLILLGANDSTYWRGYLILHDQNTSTRFAVYRVDNAVLTFLKSDTSADGLTNADTVSFRVDGSGNLSVWINDVERVGCRVTDTTYTSGKPGILSSKVTGAVMDDFSAYHEAAGGATAVPVFYHNLRNQGIA